MEKYKLAAADEWVNSFDIDLSHTDTLAVPYYFLLVDYQECIQPDKICNYKRTVEKINDESRIEDASLYISELKDENHQIIFHAIDLIRDGKRLNVLDADNISINQREISLENHITDRVHTVSFSIDDLRVGDIIDYQVTTVVYAGEHPFDGRFYHSLFWLNWNCTVQKQRVRIINNSGKAIQLQTCKIDMGKPLVVVEVVKPGLTFEKEYSDLEIRMIDNLAPEWLWPDYLLATTCTEWTELSKYLYDYYSSQGVLDDSLDISVVGSFNEADTINDKIIKIVRFVQNDIRYKGENYGVFTHTPRNPGFTLKKRYGDCKDKANLLVSLLKCINVNSYLTIVNSDYGVKIRSLSPSPLHFNHMVVCIEYQHKEYFFDPTIKKQAGDLDHATELDYGYGLPLSGEGRELIKISRDISKTVFKLKHVFDFSNNYTDENTLEITREYFSHRADNMRYYLNSRSQNQLAEEYLVYAKEDTDLEMSIMEELAIVKNDKLKNTLETKEVYLIKDLTDDDKQLSLLTNIYQEFPVTINRDMPVRIDLDGKVIHEIEVIYKTNAQEINEAETITNKWFDYTDSVRCTANVISFYTSVIPHRQYVDVDDLDVYFDDVEKLRLRSGNNFYYSSGDTLFSNSLGIRMIVITIILFLVIVIMRK